jgi:FkbM family methyltransferase
MYAKFKWTGVSVDRISILKQYEPIQPFFLFELARIVGCDTFVDVGANVGVYSLFMSSLESVRQVFSFEPSPETFRELKTNVEANGVADRISVFDKAVSESRKVVKFGVVSDFSGANSILASSIHEGDKFKRAINVDCISLDEIFEEQNRIFCMKIDVEGHERDVLIGAKRILCTNKAIVQIENYGREDTYLTAFFSECGYTNIASIGPDQYFSNIQDVFNPPTMIKTFEVASKHMIASNLDDFGKENSKETPIRLELLETIALEISGDVAKYARRVRNRLRA